MGEYDLILIKGEPKTQQIVTITEDNKGVYWVKFKFGKTYHLANRDVNILKSPKEISIADCRISNRMGEKFNSVRIWEYTHSSHKFYRIEFANNDIREYDENYLNISKSVLADDEARNVFNYIKNVSGVQSLMTENGPISLHDKYEKVDFIDENTALCCYLCPDKIQKRKGYEHLMFPFYSNLSQMKAVDNAFKSQISVVQGPPGTGKTQTILNIVANIVARKKNVLMVSNNNSAVENVKEKLDKEGLGFIVAELGKSDNRNDFISKEQTAYPDMSGWKDDSPNDTLKEIDNVSKELKTVFEKQNQLAKDRQELSALEIESEHFFKENSYDKDRFSDISSMTSEQLVNLWVRLDIKIEKDAERNGTLWVRIIKRFFQNLLISYRLKKAFGKQVAKKSDDDILLDIKAMFYKIRKEELQSEIDEIADYLKDKHADELLKKQAFLLMKIFKAALFINYEGGTKERTQFVKDDLWKNGDAVAEEYPVVLSTTFSAISSLPGHVFDYLIMDEASQVPVESAAIALSCANNAVIVGDLKQLPNIVTDDDKENIKKLNETYRIKDSYNCLTNSFLSSIIEVFPDAPQTLLREHYRCAPMIINFCNQKYYGGELVIMTENDDSMPMKVIRTVKGNHSRSICSNDKVYVFNQREVDEFMRLKEAIPDIPLESVGIITPYKGQALRFRETVRDGRLEADTIHKYQGREKDIIVMSTVADQYNDFVDNANLINVAVSRAKKKFILITNGNDNPKEGSIKDLISYINYNHGKVEYSNLHSIFDLLYSSYTKQRMSYLQGKENVSEFDSENIAYNVLSAILKKNEDLSCLEIIPHYHLSTLINDTSQLTEEEYEFARASWSHVDFLIENRVSKQPVLVIEVDGFAYHHTGTKQAERDKLKDSILNKYNIPLLRLSTAGSGEIEKIKEKLYDIIKALS